MSSDQQLNRCFHERRVAEGSALPLTFEHQPITPRPTATFRGRSAAAAQAKRLWVFCHAFLNVQDAEVPLPQVQEVVAVEELLLTMQAKRSQWPSA
ncbi:MAG TPA: hypothetical protein VFD73_08985 [Gemmatimonadales bacterium]|nr:hypothetical protein [Gemmatimonadales bacterium]